MSSLDIALTLVRGPGRLSALAPRSAQLLLVFNLPQIETALLQIETALPQIETRTKVNAMSKEDISKKRV